jgi:signal transduction histidine kinase
METTEGLTFFASPERSSAEQLARQRALLERYPLLRQTLDAFPEAAMVLNEQRQIVVVNDKLVSMLQADGDSLLGKRPGEALACLHSGDLPAGCGTTEFCKYCGAANAVVGCQRNGRVEVQECRIVQAADAGGAALDLRVWATPLVVEGERFAIFALRDTTDEKRREVLERLFFHDVLNSAGGLKTLLEIWPELRPEEVAEMTGMARSFADQLVEQIQAQRDLVSAERGDLSVHMVSVDLVTLLADVSALYSRYAATRLVSLAPPLVLGARQVRSDPLLLRRILGNLVKNAIEASECGQTVSVTGENHDRPVLRVHNESVMSEAVRAQVFQRSFSTKDGKGRGVGCYSVKLLTERYLGGKVTFTSGEFEGTTFTVELPSNGVAN